MSWENWCVWDHVLACVDCGGLFFPSCRLNEEARRLIAELGSSSITNLGFRDNWVFCGGKGIKTKSPFEQVSSSDSYRQQQIEQNL